MNGRFREQPTSGLGREAPVGRDQHEAPFHSTKEPLMDTVTKTEGRAIPWNKGKLLGQKPPLKLKEIWAIRIRLQLDSSIPRTRVIQPRHRQQVARVRSGWAPRPRCGPGQSGRRPRDCHAEEDTAAGAVRDHRANAGRGRRLDHGGASETGAVPLSEPRVGVAPSFDPAVFPDRRVVGRVDRAGPGGLRHAFAAAHQSRR